MKNIMKKFASLALVTSLFVGTQASTAMAIKDFADPNTNQWDNPGAEATIEKTLQIKDSVKVKDQFEFKIEPVDPNTLTPKPTIEKLEKGVDNYVTLKSNKTEEKEYSKDDNKSSVGLSYDSTIGKTLVNDANPQRRFLYKITEVGGGRDGMTYDTSVKYLVVEANYSKRIKANGKPLDKNAVYHTRTFVYNEDFSKKLGSINFTNGYGKDPDGTPNTNVRVLKVSKEVQESDGSLSSEKDKEFTINVIIKGELGDIFTYNGVDYKVTEDKVDTGVSITLTLKNGDEINIDGLTDKDGLKVTEVRTEEINNKYTVSGEVGTKGNFDNFVNQNDDAVKIINKKKPVPPLTGLLNNIGPFILVIGLAGVFAVIYFKKNQRELA